MSAFCRGCKRTCRTAPYPDYVLWAAEAARLPGWRLKQLMDEGDITPFDLDMIALLGPRRND